MMTRTSVYAALTAIVAIVLAPPVFAGGEQNAVAHEIEEYAANTPAWQKVAELEPGSVVIHGADGGSYGSGRNQWTFLIAPYLWVPGMDGDVGIKGRETDVESSVSDTVDLLKDHLEAAFILHLELWSGNWGGWLDINTYTLEADRNGRITDAEAELTQTIVEAAVAYRFDMGDGWLIEPFAGLRYSSLEIDLEIEVVGQPLFDRDADEGWLDPIVGVRTHVEVTDWLSLRLRGDIGGFGVGSDLTWSITAGGDFHLTDWFSVFLGWRWLDTDYEDGSGNSKFEYDMLQSGPILGLVFRF
jgi:hypothetical protein